MTEQEVRKGGGGKLSRTETVTVRLDPKLRYLAELAARLHRRTLSSYIEWSIKVALDTEDLDSDGGIRRTIGNEAEFLWDVDDADRFAKLALRYPHLLTHEEQVKWKLIRESGAVWRGRYDGGPLNEFTWSVNEDSLIYPRLREYWATFCAVAESGEGQDKLPTWNRVDPNAPSAVPRSAPPSRSPYRSAPPPRSAPPKLSTGFDDMDDDIPF
ncbi:hypothetical protein D621_19720 [beta proteobacterium AAP51]|nr:hypothetical protein D621_19720 [beta proteobacterium AAP51]